jgi:outer membrane protein
MVLGITVGALTFISAAGAQQPARAASDSQPAAVRTISFDEAVRIALERNTALRQARNAASLDAVNVQQARMQFLPNLTASTSTSQQFGRNFNQNEGQIVNSTTSSVSAGLQSGVTLFNGLANFANLRAAKLTEEASTQDYRRARQTVVFTVVSNFLALVQAREQLRVQQENLAAEEALERQIQEFVNAGSRTIADLYQQQAAVASARFSVVEAQRTAELAKVDLMQTLQLDPRGTFDFAIPPINTDSVRGEDYELDRLLSRAFSQRPDVGASETRTGAAAQDVRAAKAARWPTLQLTAGYNTAYSSASEINLLDQFNQRRGGSIALGFSIPLFDRGSAQTAAQQAQIRAENAQLDLENTRQDVGLQVRRAYLDYEAAQQQLATARAQQQAAQLAMETTRERYEVGAGTLIELAQSRAALVQAQSQLVSARYNLVFQRTLVDYYVGDLDPENVTLQ